MAYILKKERRTSSQNRCATASPNNPAANTAYVELEVDDGAAPVKTAGDVAVAAAAVCSARD